MGFKITSSRPLRRKRGKQRPSTVLARPRVTLVARTEDILCQTRRRKVPLRLCWTREPGSHKHIM
eukprot:102152-Amphidinium_carterae.1